MVFSRALKYHAKYSLPPTHLQIYVQTRIPANLNMKMVKDEYPDKPLELVGALGKRNHYQQFQPVVMLGKGYTMHWDQAAPAEVIIWLINFNRSASDRLHWMCAAVSTCFCRPTQKFTLPWFPRRKPNRIFSLAFWLLLKIRSVTDKSLWFLQVLVHHDSLHKLKPKYDHQK